MSIEKTTFSLEVFPPKTETGFQKLCGPDGVLEQLYTLSPQSISCTYGVGGTNAGRHMDVLDKLSRDQMTVPVSHFTCIGKNADAARAHLNRLQELGVHTVLALRGDKPAGYREEPGTMHYATELVKLIREEYGDYFRIAVSGNPEGHIECLSLDHDIDVLRSKADLGADVIHTQLCWDLDQFEIWLNKVRRAGVNLPVEVGVMPLRSIPDVLNVSLSHNGCVMDRKLCRLITRYWVDPTTGPSEDPDIVEKRRAFHEEGLTYIAEQIESYRALGVDGIHLFTMNQFDDTAAIAQNAGLVI